MVALWLDRFLEKRFPRFYSFISFGFDKKAWFKKFRFFAFCFVLLYSIFEAALGYGRFMKRNTALQEPIRITYADDQVIQGKMIGKTKDVFFLLVDDRVKIIPITAFVKEIEVK